MMGASWVERSELLVRVAVGVSAVCLYQTTIGLDMLPVRISEGKAILYSLFSALKNQPFFRNK